MTPTRVPAQDLTNFLCVLKELTQLTPYTLGGDELARSYVDELRHRLGAKTATRLLGEAACFVKALVDPCPVPCPDPCDEHRSDPCPDPCPDACPDHGADSAVVRRRVIPGEDVVPLSPAAERLLQATMCAVALEADLEAMVAAVAALTKLPPETVRRTSFAEALLLALRHPRAADGATAGRSPRGRRRKQDALAEAGRLMERVRDKLAEVMARQPKIEWRTAMSAAPAPDVATPLSRARSLAPVVRTVEQVWRRLDAFVRFVGLLSSTPPGDAGVFSLAYRSMSALERSMPPGQAAKIFDEFAELYAALAEEWKDATRPELLRALVSDLEATPRLTPVLDAGKAIVRDVDGFLAISVVLTGMPRIELVQTALAESDLDQVIRAVGEPITRALLERARSVLTRLRLRPTSMYADGGGVSGLRRSRVSETGK